MRIQKYLSLQGKASRREAESLIRRGLVTLNGKVVREMGVQIDPEKDRVEIKENGKAKVEKKISVIYHKPRKVVSSRNRMEGKTVYDLLPQFKELDIVGRLDKQSEGLLLLSNDGVIARAVTGEDHKLEKEYEVTVQEAVTPTKLKALEQGMMLDDGPTLPAKTRDINSHTFRIILKEGRNHQIRRMCEHIHLTVTRLVRLRIGPIALKNLPEGEYRILSEKEAASLR